MYKLCEFAMPLSAKAKILLLIIQNVIFLKIDIQPTPNFYIE